MAAPLALADDYWMVVHDRPNGDSYLQPKPMGVGLGAAVLCELVVTNWINVDSTGGKTSLYLHPQAADYPTPDDPVLSAVINQLLRETDVQRQSMRHASTPAGLDADEWIEHLATGSAQQLVEERLVGAALVVQQTRGRLFRSSRVEYVPENSSTSGWPAARLKSALRNGGQLTEQDLTLGGLIVATGLANSALTGVSSREREYLARQTMASMRRQLRELVISAETAIGRLVMTR